MEQAEGRLRVDVSSRAARRFHLCSLVVFVIHAVLALTLPGLS